MSDSNPESSSNPNPSLESRQSWEEYFKFMRTIHGRIMDLTREGNMHDSNIFTTISLGVTILYAQLDRLEKSVEKLTQENTQLKQRLDHLENPPHYT